MCIMWVVNVTPLHMSFVCAGPSYAPSANLAGDAEVPDFEPDFKRQRK